MSLCKRRGFIYQSAELYGGLNGCWDYGPLGVEVKRNLKEYWWRRNVQEREDIVGLDGSILTHAHAGAKDQHHQMAHTQPHELVEVNQFFTSQLAYLCARMEEVKEGDRTLLDNTAIMHCSSMIHGNHDSKQLPVILLGGAGGNLRGGRTLDYLDAPNRRMCSLFLSLMEWGGLELDRFGDSAERLIGI